MRFRATFCNPFKKDIIELGDIEPDKIMEIFEKTPWMSLLEQMIDKSDDEIYYSPSLEIENKDNKNGLSISAVGDPKNFEFYIFYKRPKQVKTFLGLSSKMNDDYVTDIVGQTHKDVFECLAALIKNDLEFLDIKIK